MNHPGRQVQNKGGFLLESQLLAQCTWAGPESVAVSSIVLLANRYINLCFISKAYTNAYSPVIMYIPPVDWDLRGD
jgi:hypothetical protein